MNANVRRTLFAGLFLLLAADLARGQVPWAADAEQASRAAADAHKLVLLHFYNDNCPPCERLEQAVFSQPQVGGAIATNFVPVKIHAGRTPELARRYQINRWPTDVFVTPSGLEVFRSISPQQPAAYVSMVNQVALQSGVGAGRQWAALGQTAQQAVQTTANQFAGQTQAYADQGQQRLAQAATPYQQAVEQANAALQQTAQQASGTAQQWSQQANDAANAYANQAGGIYRDFRDQAGGAAQQFQQQAQNTQQTIDARAEQLGDAARSTAQQWQQTLAQTQAAIGATAGPAPAPSIYGEPNSPAAAPPAAAPPAAAPTIPTDNPWFAAAPAPSSAPPLVATPPAGSYQGPPAVYGPSSPPLLYGGPPRQAEPTLPGAENQPAAELATTPDPTPEAEAGTGLVPADRAPPIALDGFCPVTLLETMEAKGAVASAWKKADPKFGAIHRGKTYLFASKEAQEKFLANPDAFTPVLSGCDPVRYAQQGEFVEGKRDFGLVYGKRIFLFADEASLNRFDQTPAAFAETAYQAMLKSETTLYR